MSRATGPSQAVRGLVLTRDAHACQWCGRHVYDGGFSIHHRRPRGMGGSRRRDANSPSNLVTLCGSGTTGCHGHVESHRDDARQRGFLVPLASDPLMHPIADHMGRWWFLLPDGTRQESTEPAF